MKKIAFVVHGYGLEITGGAEYLTRLLAEHFSSRYKCTVITNCSKNYVTWENSYKPGCEVINGVEVIRFLNKTQRPSSITDEFFLIKPGKPGYKRREKRWIERNGPYCPDAVKFIKQHRNDYDVFCFVTYAQYPVITGYKYVKDKAILIPTAHDDLIIHLPIYQNLFMSMKHLVFLTDDERDVVNRIFKVNEVPQSIIGIGIDTPKLIDDEYLKRTLHLSHYLAYVGRIDANKGCADLINNFLKYCSIHPDSELKLVLMGPKKMDIPETDKIVYLGIVDEQVKFDVLAGATLFCMPSEYESFSIALLEAFSVGTPALVNGKCEVLKSHCLKSNAGLYYSSFNEFNACLSYLTSHDDIVVKMKDNALKYIEQKYTWDAVLHFYRKIIDSI